MKREEAEKRALQLKDKWQEIITDAFIYGYLVDDICMGCGKRNCDGCPAGTETGWNSDIRMNKYVRPNILKK